MPSCRRSLLPCSLALAAPLVLIASSCSFQSNVPAAAQISCSADGGEADLACPSGFTCQPALGRCVATTSLGQAPVGLVASSLSLTPAIGNLHTTFQLQFQVTRALAFPPTVYAARFSVNGSGGQVTTYPFSCGACAGTLACSCSLQLDSGTPPADGPLQVSIEVVDEAGNVPPPFSAGSFDLDTAPPQLVPPTVLQILPGPGVDTPVSEVGPFGSAQVCFAVNKNLAATPSVWGAASLQAPPDFPLALESTQGNGYCFDFDRDGGPIPDGVRGLYTGVTDLAGNSATLTLVEPTADGGLVLQSTPPQPPDLSADAGLRYRRAPWGELPANLGVPSFSISAAGANAIPAAGWLIVTADQAQQIELARAPVQPGPLPPLALVPQDWPEAWVDLVDLAGNHLAGGPVLIPNVDWVANLGRKVPGDTSDNPNSCHARSVSGFTLLQPDDLSTELGAPQPDGGADVVNAAATWRQRIPAGPPVDPGGDDYDSARGRTVAYTTLDYVTYEYDGVDWLPASPFGSSPSDRGGAAMAYDSLRGRSVLFGGYDSFSSGELSFCDTWEWDGSHWQVRSNCLSDPTPEPVPRYYSCLAYDPTRGVTVLVDGLNNANNDIGDQWTWDGEQWTELSLGPPDGGTPTGGIGCTYQGMAYLDVDGGELVAVGNSYGGGGVPGPDPAQVAAFADGGYWTSWVGRWNGTTYAWQIGPLFPGFDTPVSLAVDPITNELAALVFPADPGQPAQLWRWDGVDPRGWVPAAVVPTLPTVAFGSAELTLIWGGPDDSVHPFRLVYWNFVGATPLIYSFRCGLHSSDPSSACILDHHLAPTPGPENAYLNLAFDARGHGLLDNEVSGPDAGSELGMWLWDGMDWNLGPQGPPAVLTTLAYQPVDGRFWLFSGEPPDGGIVEDFWALSLDAGWVQLPAEVDAGILPYSMVFVPNDAGTNDSMIALGTQGTPTLDLTLGANGIVTSTSLKTAPQGSPAYDPVRQKMVVACVDPSNDIEEAAAPDFAFWNVAKRDLFSECSAMWDPASQQLLIIGGESPTSAPIPGDVAVWNGVSLTPVPLADAEADGNPQTPNFPTAAVDAARQSVLNITTPPGVGFQTWEMSLATVRPEVVCQWQFGEAQAPTGSTLTGVLIQAEATSGSHQTTYLSPVTTQPTRLALWERAHWVEVAACDAGACPADLGPLEYQVTDPTELSRLIRDEQIIGVSIGPQGPGTGKGTVAVRDEQVVVSYRLP